MSGKIKGGEATNTALPRLTAELLIDEFLVLSNLPYLADNQTMGLLLEQQGNAVEPVTNDECKLFFAGSIIDTEAPYNLVGEMCAEFLVLGYLLAWMSEFPVSLPGGYINARVEGPLRCATIVFPFLAIGATVNLLIAVSPAEGRVILANGARANRRSANSPPVWWRWVRSSEALVTTS